MHAGNGAERRARFGSRGFAADIVDVVIFKRDTGMAALLGAIVHQAVLTNVQKASAGAAMPVVGETAADVFLKMVEMGEGEQTGFQLAKTIIDGALVGRERLKLAAMIVQNSDGAGESEIAGALADDDGVL